MSLLEGELVWLKEEVFDCDFDCEPIWVLVVDLESEHERELELLNVVVGTSNGVNVADRVADGVAVGGGVMVGVCVDGGVMVNEGERG